MADVHATAYRYESLCTDAGVKPNEYIMKMFNKEKEDTILEIKDAMYLYLAGNNKLLTDKRIVDDDIKILAQCLENNLYVSELDVRYNNITDEGAKYLAKLIEESTSLIEVNLMFNDIGPEGAEVLAKVMQKNETLRTLRMTGNKIGNKGGMYFAQALQVNTGLESLDLGDTDLTIESIIALATVLNHNNTLKSLNVNRPILFTQQEEGTVHFANMLKVNSTLEELHLQKYEIRDFGATRLADNLLHNFTLTHLDLSCNRITRDGTKELAKVLKQNTALKVLDLGFNRLEDDGAIHIANALATYNNVLETLIVVKNNIKGKGLCALADALKSNMSVKNIYIWGNVLEESACIAFAHLLDTGRIERGNTDVQAYVVDDVTYLAEKDSHPNRHYYYAPSYGDDVPQWMPKGKNPRGSETIIEKDPPFHNF